MSVHPAALSPLLFTGWVAAQGFLIVFSIVEFMLENWFQLSPADFSNSKLTGELMKIAREVLAKDKISRFKWRLLKVPSFTNVELLSQNV